MKLFRLLTAALMAGVLFSGPTATPSLAATKSKSKETSVLSKMATNTKKFVSGIFGGKKTTSKKKSTS